MKKYYVTMTDKFLSGWGMAKGLTNKLIFVCDSFQEAQIVMDNAIDRKDMKYINICFSRPSYYRKTKGNSYECQGYYVQIKTKGDYSTWYVANSFNS